MFSLTDGQLGGMVSIFRRIEKLNGDVEYDLMAVFRFPVDAIEFLRCEARLNFGVLCGGALFVVTKGTDLERLEEALADLVDRQLSDYNNTMGWFPELDLLPECDDSDDDEEGLCEFCGIPKNSANFAYHVCVSRGKDDTAVVEVEK